MSRVLAIDAGSTGVSAIVVGADGLTRARGHAPLAQHHPEPGWAEHAPEEIWQATLAAVRQVLDLVDVADLSGIGLTHQRDTVVLWDAETLGAPRRAVGSGDRRTAGVCGVLQEVGRGDRVRALTGQPVDEGRAGPRLRWLAEHEPRTWGLVEEGRYAVGPVGSYLVARMTRGLEHVTDVSSASHTLLHDLGTGDWSDELGALFGVPRDALPEIVPSWGEVATTDARSFLGLSLPVAGLADHRAATLVGQVCLDENRCAYAADAVVLAPTGGVPVRRDGLLTTAAWRSPGGTDAFALEGSAGPGAAGVRDVLALVPAAASLRVALPDGADGASGADDRLCQDLADRCGVVVERPRRPEETSARGAAYLAGLGTGLWDSPAALHDVWPLDRRFTP